MAEGVLQWKMAGTPVGHLYISANGEGITELSWEKSSTPLISKLDSSFKAARYILKAEKQLREYFLGERKEFELPFSFQGTTFQKQVWQELRRIPFGQAVSYQDIAVRIRNPKAVRAVGSANGCNPLCILIPCHRVIAKDGTLGGFSGDLKNKAKLLQLEKKYSSM